MNEKLRGETRLELWKILSHDAKEMKLEDWERALHIEEYEIYNFARDAETYHKYGHTTFRKYSYWTKVTTEQISAYWENVFNTLNGYNLEELKRYGRVLGVFTKLTRWRFDRPMSKLLMHVENKTSLWTITHLDDKCVYEYLYMHYKRINSWVPMIAYARFLMEYESTPQFVVESIQNAYFFGLGQVQDYDRAIEYGASVELCKIGGFDPICIRIMILWFEPKFALSLRLVCKRWNHELMTYCTEFWKRLGRPKIRKI